MDLNFEEHLLYVDFLITRTRNFRLCGVEPVLVFDGKRNSLKVCVSLCDPVVLVALTPLRVCACRQTRTLSALRRGRLTWSRPAA